MRVWAHMGMAPLVVWWAESCAHVISGVSFVVGSICDAGSRGTLTGGLLFGMALAQLAECQCNSSEHQSNIMLSAYCVLCILMMHEQDMVGCHHHIAMSVAAAP